MVPKSLLNQLRRELVQKLDELAGPTFCRAVAAEPVLPRCWPRSFVRNE